MPDPTNPPGEGWAPWLDPSGTRPPDGGVLEVWRAQWGNETHYVRKDTMHPAMNVAGLWWRVG